MTLEQNHLKASIEAGNVGMVLEHLADTDPDSDTIKSTLAAALRKRAIQKEEEANQVDASVSSIGVRGLAGDGSFERRRSRNLAKLANKIEGL